MGGAIFETYAVSEIVKSYWHSGRQPELYYYRDVDKKEVDLLIVKADRIYPIEIKKGKAPERADHHFAVLDKLDKRIEPGLILCNSDEFIPYSRRAWYCPVELL